MSKKTLATFGLAAAMLVPGVAKSEGQQKNQDDVNKKVTELFVGTEQDALGDDTISLSDAEKLLNQEELKLSKKEMMDFIKKITEEERKASVKEFITKALEDRSSGLDHNMELKKINKQFGEEYLINTIDAMTKTILEDTDRYWEITNDGEFVLNQEQVENLVKTAFPKNFFLDGLFMTSTILLINLSIINLFKMKKKI